MHLSSYMCVLLMATGVAVCCCSVELHCVVTVSCSSVLMQCIAACCSVERIGYLFQQLYVRTVDSYRCCSVLLQRVAACCSVLQYVVAACSCSA